MNPKTLILIWRSTVVHFRADKIHSLDIALMHLPTSLTLPKTSSNIWNAIALSFLLAQSCGLYKAYSCYSCLGEGENVECWLPAFLITHLCRSAADKRRANGWTSMASYKWPIQLVSVLGSLACYIQKDLCLNMHWNVNVPRGIFYWSPIMPCHSESWLSWLCAGNQGLF